MTRLTMVGISCIIISVLFTSQGDAISPKSIMAMWLFDDIKGENAPDASKNGHDGEIHGAELVEAKKFAKALNFTGDDFVDCGMKEYDFGGAITVVLWLKHIGGDYRGVINNGYWEDCSWEIRFGREDAGTRLGTRINTDKGDVRFSLHPSANEWHHIALVYDGKKVEFYLDGSAEQEGDLTGKINKLANPVVMGHNGQKPNAREWYSGLLDEIAIFNVGLTKDDIQDIMARGLEGASAVDLSDKLATTWGKIRQTK